MITELLNSFFEDNLYLFMFIIPFLAQMGIPIGAMFFILYAGSVALGYVELSYLFIIILFATIIGDCLSYYLSRRFALSHFMKILLERKNIKIVFNKSKLFFNKHGGFSIFITRFLITGIGPYLNYVIGLQKYNFRKFFVFVVLGEILYAAELLLIGFIFKETFEDIMTLISEFSYILLIGFVLYYIGKKVYVYEFKKHHLE